MKKLTEEWNPKETALGAERSQKFSIFRAPLWKHKNKNKNASCGFNIFIPLMPPPTPFALKTNGKSQSVDGSHWGVRICPGTEEACSLTRDSSVLTDKPLKTKTASQRCTHTHTHKHVHKLVGWLEGAPPESGFDLQDYELSWMFWEKFEDLVDI